MAVGKTAIRLAKAAFHVSAEGTRFTESEPASPGIMCYDVSMDFGDANQPRTDYSDHFGKYAEVAQPQWGKVSFKQSFLTGGVAGTQPYNNLIIAYAGHQITDNTTVSTVIKPWTNKVTDTASLWGPKDSVSFALWEDGIKYRFKGGAPSQCALVFEIGKPAYWEFAFTGAFVQTEDEAMGTVVTTPAPAPIQFIGASVIDINALNFAMTSFRIDYNYSVGKIVSINDANGVLGFVTTDRRLRFKCDPAMEYKADYDFFDKWKTAAIVPIDISAGTAANRMQLAITKAQFDAPKPGTREMIRTLDLEGSILSSGTEGDDFTLTLD